MTKVKVASPSVRTHRVESETESESEFSGVKRSSETKSKEVKVTLTPEQHDAFSKASESEGLTMASWMRMLCVRELGRGKGG